MHLLRGRKKEEIVTKTFAFSSLKCRQETSPGSRAKQEIETCPKAVKVLSLTSLKVFVPASKIFINWNCFTRVFKLGIFHGVIFLEL